MIDKTSSPSDEELVADAIAGHRRALNQLLKRHQDYIYNLALRLFLDPDDALDATQEVLLKVVTSLSTFRGRSQFRTWLYRIVINHFLNSPQRRYEQPIDRLVDPATLALADAPASEPSEAELEEVRVLCSMAMLQCLNREQRLLYIIGEIFGADHQLGAELFGLSPGNYRVRLHRAKADLVQFVSGKCGLIDPGNPCRCPKKAGELMRQGVVDKDKLRFSEAYQRRVADIITTRKDAISDDIQLRLLGLFQDSPFQVRQELDALFGELLA